MTTWYGPGRTGLKVLHLMDCASHPSNMHLVKALQHPTQMEGFVWSSYMYMALQMYVIHVGDRCNSYGVFIWLSISCVCVCVWKVQEGLVLTEYIVAVNIFVVTYLIRVVACGDLCKRFTCMVVHT